MMSHSSGKPTIVTRSEATDKDILCGRGNGFLLHPGNLNYLKIIKEYQLIYQVDKNGENTLTNIEKREIVEKVITAIYNLDPPGRFLKFVRREKNSDDGKKEEVYHLMTDYKYIVKKVSQALRVS